MQSVSRSPSIISAKTSESYPSPAAIHGRTTAGLDAKMSVCVVRNEIDPSKPKTLGVRATRGSRVRR